MSQPCEFATSCYGRQVLANICQASRPSHKCLAEIQLLFSLLFHLPILKFLKELGFSLRKLLDLKLLRLEAITFVKSVAKCYVQVIFISADELAAETALLVAGDLTLGAHLHCRSGFKHKTNHFYSLIETLAPVAMPSYLQQRAQARSKLLELASNQEVHQLHNFNFSVIANQAM